MKNKSKIFLSMMFVVGGLFATAQDESRGYLVSLYQKLSQRPDFNGEYVAQVERKARINAALEARAGGNAAEIHAEADMLAHSGAEVFDLNKNDAPEQVITEPLDDHSDTEDVYGKDWINFQPTETTETAQVTRSVLGLVYTKAEQEVKKLDLSEIFGQIVADRAAQGSGTTNNTDVKVVHHDPEWDELEWVNLTDLFADLDTQESAVEPMPFEQDANPEDLKDQLDLTPVAHESAVSEAPSRESTVEDEMATVNKVPNTVAPEHYFIGTKPFTETEKKPMSVRELVLWANQERDRFASEEKEEMTCGNVFYHMISYFKIPAFLKRIIGTK